MSPAEGLQKVKNGNFAFFCEEPIADRIMRRSFESYEICETKKVYFQRNDHVGILIKQYSPLRERFVINFIWTREVGVFHQINYHWNGRKTTCKSNGHYRSVRLEYLTLVFIFLIVAYILSCIILLGEICVITFE